MPKAEGFIEMSLVNWDEVSERFAGSREYMLRALNTSLRQIGKLLVEDLKKETPVGATGDLRNKTVFQIMGQAEDQTLEIRQSAFSSNGFAYGIAVRQGTKPHFPPPMALVPWVQKKLGIGDEKEAKHVAYAIAVKISRVGTPANPYHERVFDANVDRIHEIVNEALLSVAARIEGA